MNARTIDAGTADAAQEFISLALASVASISASVHTEIQDDGDFLVVTVAQQPGAPDATARILEIATTILMALIPPRQGVYAWKVNIQRAAAPSFTH